MNDLTVSRVNSSAIHGPLNRRCYYLVGALLLFLLLSTYNLGLPGLHYDEAKEAGLNAMQLLTGAPITAFRDATVSLFGAQLPLMVQDYIGALNVYLALPFLWLTGIGVPNLRALAIATAVAALLLLERILSEWLFWHKADSRSGHGAAAPVSLAGLMAVVLLAGSPSFIFWSRQGLFVTNVTQPLTLACIWQGVHWLRSGRQRSLLWSALCGGLALYAKVQALWLVLPFVLLAGGWWLWPKKVAKAEIAQPQMQPLLAAGTIAAFCLPLLPLMLFNWQTGGLWEALSRNAQTSYYGVNNADLLANFGVRWRQFGQMLRGDHFWYLGGPFSNNLAPWLWSALVCAGVWRAPRVMAAPLLLLLAAFGMSLFTISDLFVTHFAMLQPVAYALAALGVALWQPAAALSNRVVRANVTHSPWVMRVALWLLIVWGGVDLVTAVRYHGALNRSGGLASHSDASYHLAYYLQYNGLGAPIVLDWGMDAPVRFLSQGAVTPVEIFGYESLAEPDGLFEERLAPFLANSDNVYLLHAEAQTVFQGRRRAFMQAAASLGRTAVQEETFSQRDGTPLFEVWRVP